MGKLTDAADGDEKYAKIQRQSQQRTRSILLSLFACCCVGAVVFYRSDLSASAGELAGLTGGNGPLRAAVVAVPPEPPVAPVVVKPPEPEQPQYPPKETPEMLRVVTELDTEVRRIKATPGVIMETNQEAHFYITKFQEATRTLMHARYGAKEPYRVKVTLRFQDNVPDYYENEPDRTILLEMAPTRLVPHSVYTFLEEVRWWQGGGFHRIADHVLQVQVKGSRRIKRPKHLAFQEYSPEWPHEKGTVGYAGRPSGPEWYVSIRNNTRAHGPGSQQKENPYEADSCFGRVISGMDKEVKRISTIQETGFLGDEKKWVLITKMKVLVPGDGPDAVDGYVEWNSSST